MYTVVIADGDGELRQALIREINWEREGFCVAGEAGTGAEALELLKRLKPDLLVTDVRMPLMSGIELARTVWEMRWNTQVVFLSGFDEAAYARQAIQYHVISYLLKPISSKEFTKELKKIRNRLDERLEERMKLSQEQEQLKGTLFFMPLILDPYSGRNGRGEQELRKEAFDRGFMLSEHGAVSYVVLITGFWDREGQNRTRAENVKMLGRILHRYMRHVSFYTEGRIVSLIWEEKMPREMNLRLIIEDISRSAQEMLNLKVFIGVSTMISGLRECHEAYLEAMDAFICARQNDQTFSFFGCTDGFEQEMVQEMIGEIEEFLRKGRKEELQSCLERFFICLEQGKLSVRSTQLVMIQVMAMVFKITGMTVGNEGARELQEWAPYPGRQIFELNSRLKDSCMDFCLKAEELLVEHRKKSSSVVCDRALAVLNSCFMEPGISLHFISKEISVSPNYLSTLIKRNTGSTFIALLTRKRMEMAKELLLGTSLKIHEISKKCGYKDQHYFSYCFKKYEGISPAACRRKHEEGIIQNGYWPDHTENQSRPM